MYYEFYKAETVGYLFVAVDRSEIQRKFKADNASYQHLDLAKIPNTDFGDISLILSFSDSTGAVNDVRTLQARIMKAHQGRKVYAVLIPGKTTELIREKSLVYQEEVKPLNFTLVLMCGLPTDLVKLIKEKYGFSSEPSPFVKESSIQPE